MKLQIIEQSLYIKAVKKLSKKYKHINEDVYNFLNSVTTKDSLGIELKSNIFKARIKNSDKKKVKAEGIDLLLI